MKMVDKAFARSAGTFAKLAAAMSVLAVTGCASTYDRSTVAVSAESSDYYDDVVYVEDDYFYDDLAPYGSWVEASPYGWVWTPYDAPLGWRPYSDGYWAYTDYGWSWISNEPFGWATYHYGRWDFDPHYGWIWVPDTVWGPSWVAWQHGNGWVGWAPLPPSSHWRPSLGTYLTELHPIPSNHWNFIEERNLSQTKLKSSIVSIARNESLLKKTRDNTRYAIRDGTPVNQGIDVAVLEKQSGRKVPRLKVADVRSPQRSNGKGVRSGVVEYYRPQLRQKATNAPPPEIREREVVSDAELRDQKERERRQMEEALAKERANLEREHRKELQNAKRKAAAEEVKKRQAAEKQSLDKHAAEQRQVLAERQQKRIVKVERPQGQEKQRAPSRQQQSQDQQPKSKAPPKSKGR